MRTAILVVLTIIFISAINLTASEGNDTLRQYHLGEIVVEKESEKTGAAGSFLTINRDRIGLVKANNVGEAFFAAPGIYARKNSRNETSFMIRGYDQRQISIFYDGVPISLLYDGLVDLSQFASIFVSEIKISKSAISSLHGANTMGSTINILSMKPAEINRTNFIAEASMQSYNFSGATVGSKRDFYWAAAADYSHNSEYPLPANSSYYNNLNDKEINSSEAQKLGLFLKGGWAGENSGIEFSANIVNNQKSLPIDIYSTKPRYWKYPKWNALTLNLGYLAGLAPFLNLKGNLFFTDFSNTLESYDDKTYTTQENKNSFTSLFDDRVLGGYIIANINTGILPVTKLSAAFRADRHDEIDDTGLPEETYSANTLSLSAEQEINIFQKLNLIAGACYDYLLPTEANGAALRPKESSFNWHFGAAWQLGAYGIVHANFSENSRFPTLKEMYSNIIGNFAPNDELQHERAQKLEAGFKLALSKTTAEINIFRSNINNLITIAYLPDNVRRFENIGSAVLQGFEVSFAHNAPPADFEINYTYLDATNTSPQSESSNLEYRPRHIANLIISKKYNFGLMWSAILNYNGSRFGTSSVTRQWVKLADYYLLDLHISQHIFDFLSVYAVTRNLGDKYYEAEFGFPQPGRMVFLGIKTEL
jgi:outer membrane cobalamin receptor